MADDITTVPISLRSRFKSMRIFAITGKAEIERAVPTNRRENQSIGFRLRAKETRKRSRRAQTKGKGNNHAAYTHQQSALALAENASQVDFKPGCKQEEDNTERCDCFHHQRRRARVREYRGINPGFEVPEDGGTKDDSCEDLAQDRGLTDLLHQLANGLSSAEKHA